MNVPRKLPSNCPSCGNTLKISELDLAEEEQKFIIDFVKEGGSLKEMLMKLKLSYPSVRNILDAIIDKLSLLEGNAK